MILAHLKGSFKASFFLLFFIAIFSNAYVVSASSQPQKIDIDKLASTDQWHALLHLQAGQPLIKDPNFILSLNDFSARAELSATLNYLNNPNKDHCVFIARHQFLQENLSNTLIPDTLNCPKYQRFKSFAPADEVSIVYTSENLTQPSSMMGHTMLAISGFNKQQQTAEHSISFLTELDSMNVASILWDTFYAGKEGFFIVKPLQQTLDEYLVKEQRNIWRYVLNIPKNKIELMQKHIWELNQAKVDYLFHRHNCSTLSQYILNVALPEMQKSTGPFISPIDVIKTANSHQVIDRTLMYPSSKWKIRMLSDFVAQSDIDAIKNGTLENEKNELTVKGYLRQELAQTYAKYRYEQGQLAANSWYALKTQYNSNEIKSAGYQIDLQDYQSPLKTPDDSHLELGFINNEDQQWLSFGWLPASHTLEDDNSQYFSENELKLNELVLKMNTDSGALKLQRWHIYSAKSLTPYDTLTGGISGNFSLGVDEFYNRNLESHLGGFITAGMGHTFRINTDMSLYYQGNTGGVYNSNEKYLFVEPELGGYVYEIWNMKTLFSMKQRFTSNGYQQTRWDIKQSFMRAKNSSFITAISLTNIDSKQKSSISIQYRHYY